MENVREVDQSRMAIVSIVESFRPMSETGDPIGTRLFNQANESMQALISFQAGFGNSGEEIEVMMKQSRAFVRDIINGDMMISDENKQPYIAFRNQVRLAVSAYDKK